MLKLWLSNLQQFVKNSGSVYTTTFPGENTTLKFSCVLYYIAMVVYVHGDGFSYVAVCSGNCFITNSEKATSVNGASARLTCQS